MIPSKRTTQTPCDPSASDTSNFFQHGESSFRRTALLCLSLQLFGVGSAVAAPLLNSEGASVGAFSGTQLYTLKAGESVSSIAKKYGLTLTELKKLNALPTFNKPFSELTVGDELVVPAGPAQVAVKSMPDPEKAEGAYVGVVKQLGGIVASDNAGRDAASMAKGAAVGAMNQEAQAWLNQFGTARAQINVDDKGNLYGSAVDILVPLADTKQTLLFSQVGGRNQDSRNTLNFGAGVRHHMTEKWLLGLNAFYDVDVTNHNRRLGVGAEAFHDNLKLAANSYMRLSNWRQSRDFADYDERPANGFDIRAQAYLPSYPQLGGKLMYEKYYGKDVGLFGKNNRQSDPQAVTVGLEHTPFPLMTWGIDHKSGSGGQSDTQVKLGFTYRFGEPLSKQVDPSAVAAMRSVAGSRLDLVERNNNIVLDYKKQVLLNMSLPTKTGVGSSADTLVASLTSKYPLAAIEWDTSALVAAGGSATPDPTNKLALNFTYPPAVNSYLVSAIARDVNGNSTARISTSIVTSVSGVSVSHVVDNNGAAANGTETNQVTITMQDGSGAPLQGEAVTFSASAGAMLTSVSSRANARKNAPARSAGDVTLNETTNAQGKVSVQVTNVQAGDMALHVSYGSGAAASSFDVPMSFSAYQFIAALSVANNNAPADGTTPITVQATVTDALNNPVSGQEVTFTVEAGSATVGSKSVLTDALGVASTTLSSTVPGSNTVKASINGSERTVDTTFVADAGTAEIAAGSLIVLADGANANNTDTNSVQVTVTDANGNPVPNAEVKFTATNGATIPGTATTSADGKVSMTLTSTTAGTSVVTATVGSSTQSVNSTFIAHAGSAEIGSGALVMTTDNQLADGMAQNVVQATITDANGNLVPNQVVTFSVESGKAALTSSTATTNASGVASMTLTSTQAGSSTLKASINGSERTVDTTFVADAGTAEIAAGSLIVLADGANANNTDTNSVQVTVTDANGNPVPNAEVKFTATNGATIPGTATTGADGKVSVTLTSTTAGTSVVTATVGSSTQSVNSTFIAHAGSAEIGSGALVMTTDNQLADGMAQNVVQAMITDANGNLVPNQVVTFSVESGKAALTSSTATTNASGVASMTLTSTQAGSSTLKASINGSERTVDTTFVADAGTAEIAAGSLIVLADGANANNTDTNSVQVTVTDANGNPVPNAEVKFTATNGATIPGTATTGADGKVSVTLTSTTAGTSVVTATVGSSTQSVNSTFIAHAGSAEIGSGALVMTTDNQLADGMAQNVVQATITDANGNLVPNQVVTFSVESGKAALTSSTATTNASGVASMTLTSTQAGSSTLKASINGSERTVDTTFVADAGTAEIAAGSLIVLADGANANNTDTNSVQVTVTDANGNPVPNAEVKFTATNGATIPGTATTGADGKVSVTLTSTTAGTSVVTATVGSSTQSVNSTFIAHAGSAEIGSGALVMTTDNQLADGMAQNVVQATITDANGNLVPNQVVTFSVESGKAALTSSTATTNASGVASMTLTSTQAGSSTLKASINGSERTVDTTFVADVGTAEIASGALVMTTDKQPANGRAQNVVQVTVTDANGNLVPAQAVTFSVESGGAKLTATTATTNASGVASMTLTSTQADSSTLKASINGSERTVDTTFVADVGTAEIASGALVMTTDKQPANGRAQNVVQVTVTDANGNLVPAQAVTFSVESGGAKLTATTATTNASGVASMTLTSTVPGSNTVKASINGSERTVDTTFAINGWIQLTPDLMTWDEADAHCKANGARLPTKNELKALWGQATVGRPSNSEMCSVYGWPLPGQCGGRSNYYWSSTQYSKSMHYYGHMDTGNENAYDDYYPNQVACVR
ncbi:Ig-like domain-containing protein [Pseudomonas chlororaphis]